MTGVALEAVRLRLEVIRELLTLLTAETPVASDELARRGMLRKGVERILTQLADAAVDINSHIVVALDAPMPVASRETFTAVVALGVLPEGLAAQLAPSVEMRDVLVRDCLGVDIERVAAAVDLALEQYAEYVTCVASWLATRHEG